MPKIYGNTEILGGDLTVLGNMVISGTQTSLNVEELYVSDNIITLNATFSGAPVLDSGIEINRGNSTNSRLIWNETTDYWVAGLSGSESTIITEAGSGLTKSNNQLEVDFGTVSSIAYVDSKNTGIYGGSGALPSDIIVNTSGFDIEFSGSGGLKTTNADASWSIGQGNTPSYQFYQVATTHNTAHYIIQQKADATNPIFGSRILSNTAKSGANAVYGYYVSIEGTHAAGNNVGGYFNAINGNNNYALITANGNVGIGELTPTEQLHVGGSIRMIDGNEGVGKVLTDVAGDGVGSWETPSGISATGTTDSIPLFTGTSDLGDSLMIQSGTGIGIGVTPTEMLHLGESDGNRITRVLIENGGATADVDGSGISLVSANVSWGIELLKSNSNGALNGSLQFKYGGILKNHFDEFGNLFFDGSNQYIQLPISGWIALDGAAGATAGLWYDGGNDRVELYTNGTMSELRIATWTSPDAFVNIFSTSTQFSPISTGFRETIPTAGASGRLIYNSTTSDFNYWNGATWSNMADNFADTDLTFTDNRVHDLNGNTLFLKQDVALNSQSYLYIDTANSILGFYQNSVDVSSTGVTLGVSNISRLNITATETVINTTSGDYDFRVKGDTDTNLIFVDASKDNIGIGTGGPTTGYKLNILTTGQTTNTNYRAISAIASNSTLANNTVLYADAAGSTSGENRGVIGLARNSTVRNLGVAGFIAGEFTQSVNTDISLMGYIANDATSGAASSYTSYLYNTQTNSTNKYGQYISIIGDQASGTGYGQRINLDSTFTAGTSYGLDIDVGGTTPTKYGAKILVNEASTSNIGLDIAVSGGTFNYAMLIQSGGVVFNNGLGDYDVHIKGDTDTFMLYCDASADSVGIGTNVPAAKLDVLGNVKITGQVYVDIPSTLSPSTNSQNIDWDNGNIQVVDFQSAPTGVTFSFSNQKTGGTYTIQIIQGPNSTDVNWPTAMKWEGGTSLTPTTTNDAIDIITMVYNGTNYLSSYGTNFA